MIPRLWLCADLTGVPPAVLVDQVAAALGAGPMVVWLRAARDVHGRSLAAAARALLPPVHAAGGWVVVGERVDVALACAADGVHLPERAMATEDVLALARARGHRFRVVSRAAHDAAGMTADADVLVLSPWGTVPGKNPPLGARGFQALRRLAPDRWVIALGGIQTPEDAAGARASGADGVAVRGAWLNAPDPARVCAGLVRALTPAPGSEHPSPLP